MNIDNTGGEARHETLDADAVCAQCNTVNAEGTLLCKVCGNNLRDQRNIRLAADQAMDLERTGHRRQTWLSAIMFLLAIGLIISTLLNQDVIVEWLIASPSSGPSPSGLWRGEYDDIFSPLLSDLEAVDLTPEAAIQAFNQGIPISSPDGVYGVFVEDQYVGAARVAEDGEDLYFVALLENGMEVRGRAVKEGNYYTALPESTALRNRGRTSAARGVAMPQGDGTVDCIGDNRDTQLSFMAVKVPGV